MILGWSIQGVWSWAGLYMGCGLGLVYTGGVVLGWSVHGVGCTYIMINVTCIQNTTINLSTIVHLCALHVQVYVWRMHTCDPYICIHVLCCLCQPFYSSCSSLL